jgi:hypothetical protein
MKYEYENLFCKRILYKPSIINHKNTDQKSLSKDLSDIYGTFGVNPL